LGKCSDLLNYSHATRVRVVIYELVLLLNFFFRLSLGRIPVLNHALFTGLYQHPDPRQTWNLIPISAIRSMSDILGFEYCRGIQSKSLKEFPIKFGFHGCTDAYMNNVENLKYFQLLISKYYPKVVISERDYGKVIINFKQQSKYQTEWFVNTLICNWIMSRPVERWKMAIKSYKNAAFPYLNDGVFDLAIQFRTWRDLGHGNAVYVQDCIVNCAIHRIIQMLRESGIIDDIRKLRKENARNFSVFITGDNATSNAFVQSKLTQQLVSMFYGEKLVDDSKYMINNSLENRHIRRIPFGEKHGCYIATTPEYYNSNSSAATQWHTGEVTNSLRYEFDFEKVRYNLGLLDWELLSEATSAVYTTGSGFALNARMKAGLIRQACDVVFSMKKKGATDEEVCDCDVVQDCNVSLFE